ncbi:zinc ribbon domain-containing protein [Haloquadratum walsbyi]|uniref:zinc ribbon domain-containing protein n=1 Tax=Haloquadratum walsbyi TaxID=293091 RepID=UPI0026EDF6CF|nr:zinc ribbon domain-containing protein [Haloquadratum walsbyi]
MLCYVEKIKPAGTSKECSGCGIESDKPMWIREHFCLSCGVELDRDRDWNGSITVLESESGVELLGDR